ncbi:MAG: hypothetical protein ABSE63_09380 [Thermoguttaceae bacterium]|jgi:hypothetical protein
MDGLMLLEEAKAMGLTVLANGQKLIIRGPQSGEHIARQLLENKTDVLEAIAKDPLAGTIFDCKWIEKYNHRGVVYWERPGMKHFEVIDPPDPCPKCNSLELWQNALGDWRCMICDPPTTALRLLKRVEIIWAKKANHHNWAGF